VVTERIDVNYLQRPQNGTVELVTSCVPKNKPTPNGLVRFKESSRWYSGAHFWKKWHGVPFIDRSGQIYAIALARWHTESPKLFATILSTVFKRLRGKNFRLYRKKRANLDTLYEISAIYTVTNNDWFFRRCHEMLSRGLISQLRKFLYWYKRNKLSKTNRFLLDQSRFACLWLQSRSDFCPSRERSHPIKKGCRSKTNPGWDVNEGQRFAAAMREWANVFVGPSVAPTLCGKPAPWGEGLTLLRGKSR